MNERTQQKTEQMQSIMLCLGKERLLSIYNSVFGFSIPRPKSGKKKIERKIVLLYYCFFFKKKKGGKKREIGFVCYVVDEFECVWGLWVGYQQLKSMSSIKSQTKPFPFHILPNRLLCKVASLLIIICTPQWLLLLLLLLTNPSKITN